VHVLVLELMAASIEIDESRLESSLTRNSR
jgi:hypothetical protein